jgi:hypothetical protein
MKLVTDIKPQLQPEDTYRFALNAVAEDILVNEKGTVLSVPNIGKIYGHIQIDRYKTILFTDDKISLFEKDTLSTLAEANFNFTTSIQGVYRIVNGCDHAIYWNDGVNPDRFFIWNRPEKFQTDGLFDTNKFRINPSIQYPTITVNQLTGGRLDAGRYSFVIECLDASGTVLYRSLAMNSIDVLEKSSISITTDNSEYLKQIYVIYENTVVKIGKLVNGTYIYDGFNSTNGDSYEDLYKILTPLVKYDVSNFMEIASDRLLRGSLKQNEFISLQKYASKIKTNFVTGSSTVSLPADEVVGLGVCYIYDNGNISSVQHIPGREKKATDAVIIEQSHVGSSINTGSSLTVAIEYTDNFLVITPETDMLTCTFEGTDEDFNIYNETLTKEFDHFYLNIDNLDVEGNLSGTLNIGNFYYNGILANGTITLLENPISIPTERWLLEDTSTENEFGYYESTEIYQNPVNYCEEDYWGVDFNNIPLAGLPMRYHRVPSRNKIKVFDNGKPISIGVSFDNIEYPDGIVGHFFVINTRDISNSTVIDAGIIDNYYIDNPRRLIYNIEEDSDEFPESKFIKNLSGGRYFDKNYSPDYIVVNGRVSMSGKDTVTLDEQDYYDIQDGPKLPYEDLELYEKQHNIIVYSTENSRYINSTNTYEIRPLETKSNLPNANLTNSIYVHQLEKPIEYGHFYCTFKRNIRPFSNWNTIQYKLLDFNNQSFNGDSYISSYDIVNFSSINADSEFNFKWWMLLISPAAAGISALLSDNKVKLEYEYIKNLWSETRVNLNFRKQNLDSIHFKDGNLVPYVLEKFNEPYYGGKKVRDSLQVEDYSLVSYSNSDYNKFSSLNQLFDYCSKCIGCFPNRIIWSETSFDEQQSDNFRVNKANNYVDVPSNRGKLIAFNLKNNQLLLRCEQGFFVTPINNQQLQTDSTNVYIGLGEFLSQPAIEPIKSDIGYAGQQHKSEYCSTEYGLVWADTDEGKVYLFDDSIKELTNNGMYQFFDKYLRINKKFKTIDFEKPESWRIYVTYDHYNKRIILHKKDYEYIHESEFVKFDGTIFSVNGTVVSFDDPLYFKNNSMTVSYSFLHEGWVSFHSYFPEYMFYDSNTFYSLKNTHLWKHNEGDYSKFYGFQRDFIVEFIFNKMNTFNANSIHYYSRATKDGEDFPEITFNKGIVFNTTETSGIFDLIYNPTINTWSTTTKSVMQSDRNYKIAQLRDLSNGNATYRTVNSLIDNEYTDLEFVNVNYQKPLHEQALFRDKYIHVRLMFNKNYKLETYYKTTLSTYSIR